MAPSPENDNAPKAPDKTDKCREENDSEARLNEPEITTTGPENKEASVSRLDDGQLKALLDEAITYKSPKDRVGKSQLFQNLLAKAEEDDRKARATSASGSELVRHYNRSATRRNRHCKDTNSSSIAEKHGGSLNDLAKDELYNATINPLYRPPKTVSTRQRQGGSLPCNVNSGLVSTREFIEEARKIKKTIQPVEYTAIDMESESLLEHDSLNNEYGEQEIEMQPKFSMQYTSSATFEITPKQSCGTINSSGVDDSVMVSALERGDKQSICMDEPMDIDDSPNTLISPMGSVPASASSLTVATASAAPSVAANAYPTNYTFLNVPTSNWTCYKKSSEEKKVDENGNALGGQQGSVAASSADAKKNKKKKLQTDKNVRVLAGKDVEGHRSDIIHDVDRLLEFIRGDTGNKSSSSNNKSKSGANGNVHKTKLNKQHASSEEKGGKKQRVRAKSKGENLQKSSSMEEISSTKLEDFEFTSQDGGAMHPVSKVPLRNTKSSSERPRERRSWGNSDTTSMDFEQIQSLQIYPNASAENLENADFHVVTKKKKSKRRRNNSLNGRRQVYGRESDDFGHRRSPEPRKSARSVPQSEKSNDSSDEDHDSVRSLPVTSDRMNNINQNYQEDDDINAPVSYADIARNSVCGGVTAQEQRPRWNRPPSERKQSVERVTAIDGHEETKRQSPEVVQTPKPPPDVNSLQNWPAITNNNNNVNNNNNKVTSTTEKCVPVATKQKNIVNSAKNVKINNHYASGAKDKSSKSFKYSTEPMQMIRNSSETMNNASNLPHDVPDVQTIEKMHLQNVYAVVTHEICEHNHVNVQQLVNQHDNVVKSTKIVEQEAQKEDEVTVTNSVSEAFLVESGACAVNTVTVDSADDRDKVSRTSSGTACTSDRRTNATRPAVVILSGDASKSNEVAGLTFGFEVNEQLLSDDVCEMFASRFVAPNHEVYSNHQRNGYDKIVNFIGKAWDDVVNQMDGKVKYYNDQL